MLLTDWNFVGSEGVTVDIEHGFEEVRLASQEVSSCIANFSAACGSSVR